MRTIHPLGASLNQMSTPKNHHYVSQCQQIEFFNKNEGKIYVYDKILDNHYDKRTTKSLFSEAYINSKVFDGEVNHIQLELELKVIIEDEYPKHLETVNHFLNTKLNFDATYESLVLVMILGVLGSLRHPSFKKSFEKRLKEIDTDLLKRISGEAKRQIKDILNKKLKTKFANDLGYLDTAFRILERMEPFNFEIFLIKSSDSFLLPDTSGFQVRGQLHQYPNSLINEIIQIGLPITKNIFVLGTSNFVDNKPSSVQVITDDNSETVFSINKDLYNFSVKAVACHDRDFLKTFVNRMTQRA